jgi:hypothetical protein
LIGGLFVWVLSFVMILSVYGRFFKMYMYTAIAPVPLSTFAGEPTQNIGKSFLKSYASVCLGGSNHRSCLHHLLCVRIKPACCQSHARRLLWSGAISVS